MDYLPIFINIKNQRCLVVGGGEVATRKVMLLLQAGARVSVVSPELDENLEALLSRGEISHCAERFSPNCLDGVVLVIAATNDHVTNQQVSELAKKRHIPVNVVDNSDLCSFIMPSIVDRSPMLIAISSGGQSPVLARLLRAHLETTIPAAVQIFNPTAHSTLSLSAGRRWLMYNQLTAALAQTKALLNSITRNSKGHFAPNLTNEPFPKFGNCWRKEHDRVVGADFLRIAVRPEQRGKRVRRWQAERLARAAKMEAPHRGQCLQVSLISHLGHCRQHVAHRAQYSGGRRMRDQERTGHEDSGLTGHRRLLLGILLHGL